MTRGAPLAAYGRFVKWQIASRLAGVGMIVPFVDHTMLAVNVGQHGATGNIYVGLMEFDDMSFTLHLLTAEDLFGDVGANVGVYSILAAGVRGASVISIEPVPATVAGLRRNIAINDLGGRVVVKELGVGDTPGTLHFSVEQDSMNHVDLSGKGLAVQVDILDAVFADRTPTLIKIDVEGFETSTLNGATRLLNDPELKAIIIELNGLGARYGFEDSKIDTKLKGLGFSKFTYDPLNRNLTPVDTIGRFNTIYVRDLAFVEHRLKAALPFKVLGNII